MIEAILAIDKNNGIGLNGSLPWKCKAEMKIFKYKTTGHVLVCGKNTYHNVKSLVGRTSLYILSRHGCSSFTLTMDKPSLSFPHHFLKSIDEITQLGIDNPDSKIFVIGGAQIYNQVFDQGIVDKVHLSIMNDTYQCDTFIDITLLQKGYIITSEEKHSEFTHYILERKLNHAEYQYLALLKNVITPPELPLLLFSTSMKFDLRDGFPLFTTKRMFLKGVIEELLFFIRGETDTMSLMEKGGNIWTGNTSREYAEGVMGAMYEYQLWYSNAPYTVNEHGEPIKPSSGVDQLQNVIDLIVNDPTSRRIIITTLNPHHNIIQFYVQDEYLDMYCYNQSQDLFLETPWNIASSALLFMIICKLTQKTPRIMTIGIGDYYIYEAHIAQVREQLGRLCYKLPALTIIPTDELPEITTLDHVEQMTLLNFRISDYNYHL